MTDGRTGQYVPLVELNGSVVEYDGWKWEVRDTAPCEEETREVYVKPLEECPGCGNPMQRHRWSGEQSDGRTVGGKTDVCDDCELAIDDFGDVVNIGK